ncbi:hypothetical protein CHISP_1816 [Chitinispirillum alkaliphilum]|nr:hypothetical protein CHISP_1816 [Chitinispirillum alkaliphilum]
MFRFYIPGIILIVFCSACTIYAQECQEKIDSLKLEYRQNASETGHHFAEKPYSPQRDIAFVSTMGRTPDFSEMKGFQKAVLYNAQGALIQEVDITRENSIHSLDEMIKRNSRRGPVIIRMVR